MKFKGRGILPGESEDNDNPLIERRLTWCDVFYMAAVEASRDKQILITRFPILKLFKHVVNQWHRPVMIYEKPI